jgi:hypothetical protein
MNARGFIFTLAALVIVLGMLTLLNDQSEAQSSLADKTSEYRAVRQFDQRYRAIADPLQRLPSGISREREIRSRLIPFDYQIDSNVLIIKSLVNLTGKTDADLTYQYFNNLNFYRAFIMDPEITKNFVEDVSTIRNRAWGGSSDDAVLTFSIQGTCARMVIRQIRPTDPQGIPDLSRAEIYFERDPLQTKPGSTVNCVPSSGSSSTDNLWTEFVHDINVNYDLYTNYAGPTFPGNPYDASNGTGGPCNDNAFASDTNTPTAAIQYYDQDHQRFSDIPANGSGALRHKYNSATDIPPSCFLAVYRHETPPLNNRYPNIFRVEYGKSVQNVTGRFLQVWAPMNDVTTYGNGEATIKITFQKPVLGLVNNDFNVMASDPGTGYSRGPH